MTKMLTSPRKIPQGWTELEYSKTCSLHGIAPYIGRLKDAIARSLVLKYSSKNDLVADPFCGSGTLPLESIIHGRSIFASDCNEYALLLTRAKTALYSEPEALTELDHALTVAKNLTVDLLSVPEWVQQFFHAETLKETIALVSVLKERNSDFLLASLLGILHHQRPGFLSYPSSHLVPYLRTRSFPQSEYPELYEYRDIRSRLEKKIKRTFKRVPESFKIRTNTNISVQHNPDQSNILLPEQVDCIITSPPYMNALDYVRDNRLRLWMLSGKYDFSHKNESTRSSNAFQNLMVQFLEQASKSLVPFGRCILVIGETTKRSDTISHPARILLEQLSRFPVFQIENVLKDKIPDIRRSRKDGRATKNEIIIVLQKRPQLSISRNNRQNI